MIKKKFENYYFLLDENHLHRPCKNKKIHCKSYIFSCLTQSRFDSQENDFFF